MQVRDGMIEQAFGVWLEHVGGKKKFDRFCQDLGLIEKNEEPAVIRKMKAKAALERAEAIRQADKARFEGKR